MSEGNFPESGKFHVIRIQDQVLVFKYFGGFLSLYSLWNFKQAALRYPRSFSLNELRVHPAAS